MLGINSFGPMGGVNAMYQNLTVNRRQSQPVPQTEDAAAEGQAAQQGLSALAARSDPASQMPVPAQEGGLPTVESLGNASETLTQMRVQFSDPADAAFERFQAESASRIQDVGQTPPEQEGEETAEEAEGQVASLPAGEDIPDRSTMQMPLRAAEGEQFSAQGPGQVAPPPQENAGFPTQTPNEQAGEGTAAPLAAVPAGIT